jgi:hypothetical protein
LTGIDSGWSRSEPQIGGWTADSGDGGANDGERRCNCVLRRTRALEDEHGDDHKLLWWLTHLHAKL